MVVRKNIPVDLMSSGLAVLIEPADHPEVASISQEELHDLLNPPFNIVQGPGLLSITSQRDQVQIQLGSNKIDVQDQSGDLGHGRRTVPEVLHGFWGLMKEPQVHSYGINFILKVSMAGPEQWIGSHLLVKKAAGGNKPSSPLVAVKLRKPPKEWTVRFEASGQDSIVVNFNASEDGDGDLLSQDALAKEIAEQYGLMEEYLQSLGLSK